MEKPRIFLGSSGKQKDLLETLTRGLEDIAHVEPWTTQTPEISARERETRKWTYEDRRDAIR